MGNVYWIRTGTGSMPYEFYQYLADHSLFFLLTSIAIIQILKSIRVVLKMKIQMDDGHEEKYTSKENPNFPENP